MPAVHLYLDSPLHGWLPVRLRVDGQTFHFDASDVPNNPVEELATLLDQLATGGLAALSGGIWNPLAIIWKSPEVTTVFD